jgi:hypothetical protein
MSDIIRQAAAIPVCPLYTFYYVLQTSSRKRKQAGSDFKPKTASVLDGAVDDLFSSAPAALPPAALPAGPGSLILYAPAANKSELIFDEEGNMVLQVTPSTSTERMPTGVEATTTVESATCGYDYAYRRPKPTKWTSEDTAKFYEALEMYGSDQMLINTALPHFSPVQIRQKFKAEERNNPSKFNKALYGSSKKLSSTKFEQQHGLIANPVFDHNKAIEGDYIIDRIGSLVDAVTHETTDQPSAPQPQADDSDPLAALFQ